MERKSATPPPEKKPEQPVAGNGNIREGQADSSIREDEQPQDDNAYPHLAQKDKQVKNQPEFIDQQKSNES